MTDQTDRQGPAPSGKLRALHVVVPDAAYFQARVAALASRPRLPFKTFIARLLMSAAPIVADEAVSVGAAVPNAVAPPPPGGQSPPASQESEGSAAIAQFLSAIQRKP